MFASIHVAASKPIRRSSLGATEKGGSLTLQRRNIGKQVIPDTGTKEASCFEDRPSSI